MPPPLSPGARVFAPRLGFTLLALLLAVLFAGLGAWQWRRGVSREEQWTRFARGADTLLALGGRAVTEPPLFQRVAVSGRLDGEHQFLLDNRTWRGRAGYEVLTPLARRDAPLLLVDRGWVPFTGTRAELPDVRLATGTASVELTGRLALLPSPGLAIGRAAPSAAAPWPKVTSYPDVTQLATALGAAISPRILLLDPAARLGYVRDWQPPGLPPLRHYAYAIQWWTFAALTLLLWGLLSRRVPAGGRA